MLSLPFPRTEYETRWGAAQREMERRGLTAAVVFGRSGGNFDRFQDVFYLSNYYSTQSGYIRDGDVTGYRAAAHAAVILQTGMEPLLVADDPAVEAGAVATKSVGGYDVIGALAAALEAGRVRGRVAFVGSDTISARHFKELQDLTPAIEWEYQDDLILDVRVIKSALELDAFRRAGETVSAALNALFAALHSGASESEAAGNAAREVYRRQGHINLILVSHGPRTADRLTDKPIAGYSTATPAMGDIVRGWVYGAMHEGYWLDPGRTSVIGLRPTVDQRRLIESCADIVEQCRAAIRPGARVKDVAMLGAQLRRKFAGSDDEMASRWPLFGHGNGLFWDPPVITEDYAGKHDTFREGMVASTETFLAIPHVGGAGFEQNFIITNTGTELLTTTPMVWW